MKTGLAGAAPSEAMRTHAAAGGALIAYRLLRPGAPRRTIVLIHGLASNLTRWSEFVAATRLSATWDILRLDLRGHGDSLYRGRVGMDEWCADLAAILGAEAVPSAVIVGHCLGANLALSFAHRHPSVTAGLVLVEPMVAPTPGSRLAQVTALRPLLRPLVCGLRALTALGIHRRTLAPLDLARLDLSTRAAMARDGGAFPDARYASPWEDLRSLPTVVYLQDLLALAAPLPDLAQIRAPALALLSAGTVFSDPDATARQLARLPSITMKRLDASHWIPTEQPEAMRSAIEDWCDALGRDGGG